MNTNYFPFFLHIKIHHNSGSKANVFKYKNKENKCPSLLTKANKICINHNKCLTTNWKKVVTYLIQKKMTTAFHREIEQVYHRKLSLY